jgi:outer membrane protein assembly factor BamB
MSYGNVRVKQYCTRNQPLRNLHRAWRLVFCLAVALASSIFSCHATRGGNSMESPRVVNSRLWGDLSATSYEVQSTAFSGDAVWFREWAAGEAPRAPIMLAIVGDKIFVNFGGTISCHGRDTGDLVWKKDIYYKIAFDTVAEGIRNIDHSGYYEVLGFDGELAGDRRYVPYSSDLWFVHLMFETDSSVSYVTAFPGKPVRDRGQVSKPPEVRFYRLDAGTFTAEWVYALSSESLVAARATNDLKSVCIATVNDLHCIGADAIKPEDVTKIGLEGIQTVSLSRGGDILVVHQTEEGQFLRSLQQTGEENWVYAFDSLLRITQPPASSPDGTTFIASSETICAIREGQQVWTYTPPIPNKNVHITVLGDDSILAACGTYVSQISPAGEVLGGMIVDFEPTTRPIVDEKGHVYLAGLEGIICLK